MGIDSKLIGADEFGKEILDKGWGVGKEDMVRTRK